MLVFQSAKRKLVEGNFVPVLDYGDVYYRHITKALLQSLDSVYHSVLRFVTHAITYHCTLYEMVGWPLLHIRRHSIG